MLAKLLKNFKNKIKISKIINNRKTCNSIDFLY